MIDRIEQSVDNNDVITNNNEVDEPISNNQQQLLEDN